MNFQSATTIERLDPVPAPAVPAADRLARSLLSFPVGSLAAWR